MRSMTSALTSSGLGMHGRLAGEFGERAHAPLERFDLAHDDLRGLSMNGAIGRAGCRASISSTVRRIGVSEFFTSWAIFRASVCQLAICVR